MPKLPILHELSRAPRIAVATVSFVVMLVVLSMINYFAVSEMRSQANRIDDGRAVHAAQAATRSFQARLAATTRDNAVWDDASKALGSAGGADWAYENWGKVTADYPLYDAEIVLAPDHKVISAYKKGKQFDPTAYFGRELLDLTANAKGSRPKAVSAFLKTADGIYLVSAGVIQPFSFEPSTDALPTLIYAKLLSPDVVFKIEETFDIQGLTLALSPPADALIAPLAGPNGNVVGYFGWPSRRPGDSIYGAIGGYVIAELLLLICFFIAVVATGARIGRRLQNDAIEAHHRACRDALTGSLNRAGLVEHVQSKPAGLALGLIDLDGFKDVNDTWGHAVGDKLVQMVAERLTAAMPTDTVFARLGGDEFAYAVDPSILRATTARIMAVIKAPFLIAGRIIEIGASIGERIGAVR